MKKRWKKRKTCPRGKGEMLMELFDAEDWIKLELQVAVADATSVIYDELADIIMALHCHEDDELRESNEVYYQRQEDLKVEVELGDDESEWDYPPGTEQEVESIEAARCAVEKAIAAKYDRARKRYEVRADQVAISDETEVRSQFAARKISRESGLIFQE